ncbi:MAG TPA: cation-transporting P-type ATPase, partial [Phycisphaerae bacterium]|nr:cation-transporting P-type ATPase [Phycisphaerae bacterium]
MSDNFKGDVISLTDEKVQNSSIGDIFAVLRSSADGITLQEAKDRLAIFGRNELTEKKESSLLKFLLYFWGPIPWMIEAAAILSLVVGDYRDFAIIMAMLIFNA